MVKTPRALTIAGSDSSGGAGLQADLKTFSAYGVYGMSAVTAVTIQNTMGVTGIIPLQPEEVLAQVDAVVRDIGVDAVKTGMLATAEIIDALADYIKHHGLKPLVIDPVMRAKNGEALLKPDAVAVLVQKLFPLATIVTPNIPEAELLSGITIRDDRDMIKAGENLMDRGCHAVVIKGGHYPGSTKVSVDILMTPREIVTMSDERVDTHHTHGSGCTFASAITAGLARGWALDEAVSRAKDYVTGAIRSAPGLGRGYGPLNHFWYPKIPFPQNNHE